MGASDGNNVDWNALPGYAWQDVHQFLDGESWGRMSVVSKSIRRAFESGILARPNSGLARVSRVGWTAAQLRGQVSYKADRDVHSSAKQIHRLLRRLPATQDTLRVINRIVLPVGCIVSLAAIGLAAMDFRRRVGAEGIVRSLIALFSKESARCLATSLITVHDPYSRALQLSAATLALHFFQKRQGLWSSNASATLDRRLGAQKRAFEEGYQWRIYPSLRSSMPWVACVGFGALGALLQRGGLGLLGGALGAVSGTALAHFGVTRGWDSRGTWGLATRPETRADRQLRVAMEDWFLAQFRDDPVLRLYRCAITGQPMSSPVVVAEGIYCDLDSLSWNNQDEFRQLATLLSERTGGAVQLREDEIWRFDPRVRLICAARLHKLVLAIEPLFCYRLQSVLFPLQQELKQEEANALGMSASYRNTLQAIQQQAARVGAEVGIDFDGLSRFEAQLQDARRSDRYIAFTPLDFIPDELGQVVTYNSSSGRAI